MVNICPAPTFWNSTHCLLSPFTLDWSQNLLHNPVQNMAANYISYPIYPYMFDIYERLHHQNYTFLFLFSIEFLSVLQCQRSMPFSVYGKQFISKRFDWFSYVKVRQKLVHYRRRFPPKKDPFFSISSVKNAVRPIPIKIKDECLTNTRERNINTSGIISGVLLILEYVEPYLISRTRQSIQCRVTLFFLDVTRSNAVLSHY